jgi:hypothetical protein
MEAVATSKTSIPHLLPIRCYIPKRPRHTKDATYSYKSFHFSTKTTEERFTVGSVAESCSILTRHGQESHQKQRRSRERHVDGCPSGELIGRFVLFDSEGSVYIYIYIYRGTPRPFLQRTGSTYCITTGKPTSYLWKNKTHCCSCDLWEVPRK